MAGKEKKNITRQLIKENLSEKDKSSTIEAPKPRRKPGPGRRAKPAEGEPPAKKRGRGKKAQAEAEQKQLTPQRGGRKTFLEKELEDILENATGRNTPSDGERSTPGRRREDVIPMEVPFFVPKSRRDMDDDNVSVRSLTTFLRTRKNPEIDDDVLSLRSVKLEKNEDDTSSVRSLPNKKTARKLIAQKPKTGRGKAAPPKQVVKKKPAKAKETKRVVKKAIKIQTKPPAQRRAALLVNKKVRNAKTAVKRIIKKQVTQAAGRTKKAVVGGANGEVSNAPKPNSRKRKPREAVKRVIKKKNVAESPMPMLESIEIKEEPLDETDVEAVVKTEIAENIEVPIENPPAVKKRGTKRKQESGFHFEATKSPLDSSVIIVQPRLGPKVRRRGGKAKKDDTFPIIVDPPGLAPVPNGEVETDAYTAINSAPSPTVLPCASSPPTSTPYFIQNMPNFNVMKSQPNVQGDWLVTPTGVVLIQAVTAGDRAPRVENPEAMSTSLTPVVSPPALAQSDSALSEKAKEAEPEEGVAIPLIPVAKNVNDLLLLKSQLKELTSPIASAGKSDDLIPSVSRTALPGSERRASHDGSFGPIPNRVVKRTGSCERLNAQSPRAILQLGSEPVPLNPVVRLFETDSSFSLRVPLRVPSPILSEPSSPAAEPERLSSSPPPESLVDAVPEPATESETEDASILILDEPTSSMESALTCEDPPPTTAMDCDVELPTTSSQTLLELPAPSPETLPELPAPSTETHPELPTPSPEPAPSLETNPELPVPSPETHPNLPAPSPEARDELPAPSPEADLELPEPSPETHSELPVPSPDAVSVCPTPPVSPPCVQSPGIDILLADDEVHLVNSNTGSDVSDIKDDRAVPDILDVKEDDGVSSSTGLSQEKERESVEAAKRCPKDEMRGPGRTKKYSRSLDSRQKLLPGMRRRSNPEPRVINIVTCEDGSRQGQTLVEELRQQCGQDALLDADSKVPYLHPAACSSPKPPPVETPEELASKETILSALGLQSLKAAAESAQKKKERPPVVINSSSNNNNYTGTLKTVIKIQRPEKKGNGRMIYKASSAGPCPESTVVEDDVLPESTAITKESHDSGDDDGKNGNGKQKALVIPEKASSFSIHPQRMCSDVCTYCFGKFGLLDTPCHIAQLKDNEKRNNILACETHLTLDSCLCDACFRHVDKKSNCPSFMEKKPGKRNLLPRKVVLCCALNCDNEAQHNVRRKSLFKLKKSLAKKLTLDEVKVDKHQPAHLVALCSRHIYWVNYFLACGICNKRLSNVHMHRVGPEALIELNSALGADGIPTILTEKRFLCKLCHCYTSIRLKAKSPSELTHSQRQFYESCRKRILQSHGLDVPDSDHEVDAGGETSSKNGKHSKTLKKPKPSSTVTNGVVDEISPKSENGGKSEGPSEELSDLKATFKAHPAPASGFHKCSTTIQFTGETKNLFYDLQRPYGNQSSFLRHLILLEKYFRNGDLVVSRNASPQAAKYVNGVQNRLRSYDGVPQVTSRPFTLTPVNPSPAPSVTLTAPPPPPTTSSPLSQMQATVQSIGLKPDISISSVGQEPRKLTPKIQENLRALASRSVKPSGQTRAVILNRTVGGQKQSLVQVTTGGKTIHLTLSQFRRIQQMQLRKKQSLEQAKSKNKVKVSGPSEGESSSSFPNIPKALSVSVTKVPAVDLTKSPPGSD